MDIRKWLKKNTAEDINQSREEDGDNVGHAAAGTVDVTLASVNVSAITVVEASTSNASPILPDSLPLPAPPSLPDKQPSASTLPPVGGPQVPGDLGTTQPTQVENFERLLRAIYAPQNVYCVHVDRKANATVAAAITNIASCFPNVFMVSQPVKVVYASWMRVQADLNCMSDLLNVSTEWKYFINLCGQDFPMKTNLEMVRDLKALEGANSIQFKPISKNQKWRVATTWAPVNGHILSTGKARGPAPFDLSVLKGSAYIVASRGYIHSVLTDSRIHELMEWCKDTYSPDEILWATTQQMPGVPGSMSATSHVYHANSIARLVLWIGQSKCHGHFVREVCVFAVADLPWILSHHHLFANKFDVESDSVAVFCLEEYLREKRLAEIESDGK